VITLTYWLFFNSLPEGLIVGLPVAVNQPLPLQTLLIAMLVSLLPMAVAIYGVVNLRGLFSLYERAIIFSEHNVNYFRRLGYALIMWVAANFLFVVMISIALTFNNAPGERLVVAEFDVSDALTLIIAAVILLISWVMKEGARLKDEQAYTV